MSLSLTQIDNYISSLLENAECLIAEACVLFDVNAYARAHTLAHIAREELSKCMILYSAGRRIQGGDEVDWKRTMQRLRDHKSKIRQETVKNAIIALGMGDEKLSKTMINNVDAFASVRNYHKNSSIYVGLDESGEISIPSNVISSEKAQRTIDLAKIALKDEKKINEKLGNLSDNEPGSLSSVPTIKDIDPEQFEDFIKDMGALYREALDKLHEDESNN